LLFLFLTLAHYVVNSTSVITIDPQCYVAFAKALTNLCLGSGNVLKVQKLLDICGDHLEDKNAHQGPAVLGIALVALGEEIGADMAIRSFDHLLQYGDPVIRRAVPLALGLLSISNPR
jgi:hypothetical protein